MDDAMRKRIEELKKRLIVDENRSGVILCDDFDEALAAALVAEREACAQALRDLASDSKRWTAEGRDALETGAAAIEARK